MAFGMYECECLFRIGECLWLMGCVSACCFWERWVPMAFGMCECVWLLGLVSAYGFWDV